MSAAGRRAAGRRLFDLLKTRVLSQSATSFDDLPPEAQESLDDVALSLALPAVHQLNALVESAQAIEAIQRRQLDIELPKHRKKHWLVFRDDREALHAIRADAVQNLSRWPHFPDDGTTAVAMNGIVVRSQDRPNFDAILNALAADGRVTFIGDGVMEAASRP